MGVKLQSSSGGSVEIAAPVTASNYVLTAPAVTSTVDTLARTGNVLQVVQGSTSTAVQSSSATYADTGLTATITPSSASSKVLIIVQQNGCGKGNNANTFIRMKLLKNGISLAQFGHPAGVTDSTATNAIGTIGICYLDTPSSTSPIVYKTQFNSQNSASWTTVQWEGLSTSTITLMEIAG